MLKSSRSLPAGSQVSFCIGADEIVIHPPDSVLSALENVREGIVTALTQAGYLIRVRIDAGSMLSAVMVRETADEMALKVGSPVRISIRKNAIRMIGQ